MLLPEKSSPQLGYPYMNNVAVPQHHFKDEILDRLAAYGNVAQFVSFGPDLKTRYSRIIGHPPNRGFNEPLAAIGNILSTAAEQKVNIRSFLPDNPQGNEFLYGLSETNLVLENLERLAKSGFYTIINETIDVNDGGVSGVLEGGIIEFSPGSTPRIVEHGRPASLPASEGLKLLQIVYGFRPELDFTRNYRVEFSIHPLRRGWRNGHTILWELEEVGDITLFPNIRWPNDFSEFIGDKVFGLLVAHVSGWRVPKTTVLSRSLMPFTFGDNTPSDISWVRTCPRKPIPGKFSTLRGWNDPFKLLADEDPTAVEIASVAIQSEVPPAYSGALLTSTEGDPIVEGVAGYGDSLMLGQKTPTQLPVAVEDRVRKLYDLLWHDLGSIRIEWVDDGNEVWVLQLQQEMAKSSGTVIVSGDAERFIEFEANAGLEELRGFIKSIQPKTGVILIGNVGMTSHMADVLRRAEIPSRLVRLPETLSSP
jgi:hypothetical protein